MNDKKKRNPELKQEETNFSLPSLKDLVKNVSEESVVATETSLSKKVHEQCDKVENNVEEDSTVILTGCEELRQNLIKLEPGVKANVTIKITEKCHRMMSELKLIDDFKEFRYSDIVEALLDGFIENNRTELKKKLSKRKSVF